MTTVTPIAISDNVLRRLPHVSHRGAFSALWRWWASTATIWPEEPWRLRRVDLMSVGVSRTSAGRVPAALAEWCSDEGNGMWRPLPSAWGQRSRGYHRIPGAVVRRLLACSYPAVRVGLTLLRRLKAARHAGSDGQRVSARKLAVDLSSSRRTILGALRELVGAGLLCGRSVCRRWWSLRTCCALTGEPADAASVEGSIRGPEGAHLGASTRESKSKDPSNTGARPSTRRSEPRASRGVVVGGDVAEVWGVMVAALPGLTETRPAVEAAAALGSADVARRVLRSVREALRSAKSAVSWFVAGVRSWLRPAIASAKAAAAAAAAKPVEVEAPDVAPEVDCRHNCSDCRRSSCDRPVIGQPGVVGADIGYAPAGRSLAVIHEALPIARPSQSTRPALPTPPAVPRADAKRRLAALRKMLGGVS